MVMAVEKQALLPPTRKCPQPQQPQSPYRSKLEGRARDQKQCRSKSKRGRYCWQKWHWLYPCWVASMLDLHSIPQELGKYQQNQGEPMLSRTHLANLQCKL